MTTPEMPSGRPRSGCSGTTATQASAVVCSPAQGVPILGEAFVGDRISELPALDERCGHQPGQTLPDRFRRARRFAAFERRLGWRRLDRIVLLGGLTFAMLRKTM